jgi:AcrR family transcriptional regulator
MDERKLSRRERERQRHKKEILDAAMRLFSQKGYHSVSVQEIAAEAEFATGTLYNFFESKDALYEEIMAQCGERVLSKALPILDSGDEKDRIARFIETSVETFRENASVIKLSLQATGGPRDAMNSPKKREVHTQLRAKLTEVFASGVREGHFRDIDPTVTAIVLLAALETLIFSTAQDQQEDLFEQRIAHLKELFFKGILHA